MDIGNFRQYFINSYQQYAFHTYMYVCEYQGRSQNYTKGLWYIRRPRGVGCGEGRPPPYWRSILFLFGEDVIQ